MNFYSTITFSIVILLAVGSITNVSERYIEIEQKKYELQVDEFRFRTNFIVDEVESYKNEYFEHNLTR